MFNESLTHAQTITAAALSLLWLIWAHERKTKATRIFAAAFLINAVSNIVFPWHTPAFTDVARVFSNSMLVCTYLFIAWGIRMYTEHDRPWPTRFTMYLVAAIMGIAFLIFVYPSFPIRTSFVSAVLIVAAIETMRALVKPFSSVPFRWKAWLYALASAWLILQAARIVTASFKSIPPVLFTPHNPFTSFTFITTLFFQILWAGFLLLIDGISIVEALKRGNKEIEKLARTDKLTGIFNRNSLDETVTAEIQAALRYREPLTVILFDVDHFKRVNDTFGHDVGDLVLIELAKRVRLHLRATDKLYRWGGEEFLVVANHTDAGGAKELAEKLRQEVKREPIDPAGPITVSFGVAQYEVNETKESLFKRVDQALYAAKRSGRDCVKAWDSTMGVVSSFIEIEWKPEWESGIAIIDDQHRSLVNHAREILNMLISGTDKLALDYMIDHLIAHVEEHFHDEEEELEYASYPYLAEHKLLHRSLIKEAEEFNAAYKKGTADVKELFHLVYDNIIMEHMLSADRKFFPFLTKTRDT